MSMDIRVGDVLVMKKPHPCGSCRWRVEQEESFDGLPKNP